MHNTFKQFNQVSSELADAYSSIFVSTSPDYEHDVLRTGLVSGGSSAVLSSAFTEIFTTLNGVVQIFLSVT